MKLIIVMIIGAIVCAVFSRYCFALSKSSTKHYSYPIYLNNQERQAYFSRYNGINKLCAYGFALVSVFCAGLAVYFGIEYFALQPVNVMK